MNTDTTKPITAHGPNPDSDLLALAGGVSALSAPLHLAAGMLTTAAATHDRESLPLIIEQLQACHEGVAGALAQLQDIVGAQGKEEPSS